MNADPGIPSRILVLKPSSLGDIVHTLPAVRAMAQKFPATGITWVVNPEWAPVLEGISWLEKVHLFPRREFRGIGGAWKGWRWMKKLRNEKADWVLDFQGLLRSALMAHYSRAPVRLGLSDARENASLAYTKVAEVSPSEHSVERYCRLAALAGVPVTEEERFLFDLPTGKKMDLTLDLASAVVLHPFSRGQDKSLDWETVIHLIKCLSPLTVILVGKDAPALSEKLPENAHNLLDRTALPELIWLMRQARGVISVDSGPMHLGAAVNANVWGIHGWSDPRKVGPYSKTAQAWKGGRFWKMEDWSPPENHPLLADPDILLPGKKEISEIAQMVLTQLQ